MNALNMLKSKGLKKTAQRVMLINILQTSGVSLSESEIQAYMGIMFDRITFYRTVQKLIELNVVSKIFVDDTVKYALNVQEELENFKSYIHFLCEKCKTTSYIKDTLTQKFHLPTGYVANEYEILIKGVCSSCAGNK